MITDLSQSDFKYWVEYNDKDRKCHDSEFMEEINPDLIRAFYRGRKVKDSRFSQSGFGMTDDEHLLMLSMVFSSANTILPNLIYQFPSTIVTALRGGGIVPPEESAALLTALLKMYDKKNNAKEESQEGVLNGYWFGIGWNIISYQIKPEPQEQVSLEPEVQEEGFNFNSLMKPPQEKPSKIESRETVEEEGLHCASESPLNVLLDHKTDLMNSKVRTHRVKRTLHDLMSFGGYEPQILQEIYQKFKYSRGTRFDAREIDLVLNEKHIKQRNGTWILSFIDNFDKPLQYELSTFQGKGFQIDPLVFTNEPGIRYPVSHMKIAVQVQDKIDKLASQIYETASRARNMLFINEKDLAKGTITAIEQNKIGGIALTNKPITPGTFQHASSPAIQIDNYNLIAMCQQNLTENMGADSQLVSGKSKNKTLGQDELARVGTKIRESGMQDRVKDWLISRSEKQAQFLQQYCDAQMKLEIVGEDYSDPIMAETMEKKQVEFMTINNPIAAKKFIEGVEYKYDINIEDAVKPDREKLMTDIERVIAFTSTPVVADALLQDGVRVRTSLLAREWLGNLQTLGNPQKYFEKLNSVQIAAIQTQKMLMSGGGSQQKAPAPGQNQSGSDGAQKVINSSEPEPSSSQAARL